MKINKAGTKMSDAKYFKCEKHIVLKLIDWLNVCRLYFVTHFNKSMNMYHQRTLTLESNGMFFSKLIASFLNMKKSKLLIFASHDVKLTVYISDQK